MRKVIYMSPREAVQFVREACQRGEEILEQLENALPLCLRQSAARAEEHIAYYPDKPPTR